eukprot:g29363.t1
MIAIVGEYLIRMGGHPVYAGLELIVSHLFSYYVQEEKSLVVLLFPGEFYAGAARLADLFQQLQFMFLIYSIRSSFSFYLVMVEYMATDELQTSVHRKATHT